MKQLKTVQNLTQLQYHLEVSYEVCLIFGRHFFRALFCSNASNASLYSGM